MCSSYQAVQSASRLSRFFGVSIEQTLAAGNEAKATEVAVSAGAKDTYPLHLAPFIRLQTEGEEGGQPVRVAEQGQFGLMPHFATETAFGRKTYNARSETVDSKPSFRDAWKRGQRCIVPAELMYEPCWESGKAERWAIRLPGEQPMGIAGIYTGWRAPDGRPLWTFAMLTVNADGHPVMQRFHRPEDEKRMVVILRPEDYERWLTCSPTEAKGYLRRYEGPLDASPALLESQRRPRSSP